MATEQQRGQHSSIPGCQTESDESGPELFGRFGDLFNLKLKRKICQHSDRESNPTSKTCGNMTLTTELRTFK